jgi:hypothetical protein
MAQLINWTDHEEKGGNGKVDFLRLKGDKTYRIRPVHKPVRFYKFFNKLNGQFRSAICADPEACPVKEKYDLRPSVKYAFNVIDREDDKLKILEVPQVVFNNIAAWSKETGSSPGGKDGGDFSIAVKGTGINTRYTTTFTQQKPFTKEEKKLIEDQGLFPLQEIFKPVDPDDVEKVLFGDPDSEDSDSKDSGSKNSDSKGSGDKEFDPDW